MYDQAFNNFMRSDFETAVDSSTKASWGGSYYCVELFADGSYRVLWTKQVGNMYVSPGILLPVPALNSEEWDEDPNVRFYDNAAMRMEMIYKEKMSEYE